MSTLILLSQVLLIVALLAFNVVLIRQTLEMRREREKREKKELEAHNNFLNNLLSRETFDPIIDNWFHSDNARKRVDEILVKYQELLDKLKRKEKQL